MPVTWTRIETRTPRPTSDAVRAALGEVIAAEGAFAVDWIKTRIWYMGRFKRPTGRSTNAWKAERVDWYGVPALIVDCPAENRYGQTYAKWVHLAGQPKDDKLIREVRAFMLDTMGPRLAKASAARLVRLAAEQRPVTTTIKG